MGESIVKVDLIPFLEIEKGKLFEEKILIFIQSVIINLETSNLKIIEKDKIIPSMKAEKNPKFHSADFEIEGLPTNKLLMISINNDGLVVFGVFYKEESKWIEFTKSEFIDIKKFNTIFPHIVVCLK